MSRLSIGLGKRVSQGTSVNWSSYLMALISEDGLNFLLTEDGLNYLQYNEE